MGNAFLYGNGGTAALNFRVLGGTTQPQNPRENDIWVNTTVFIQRYSFNATQPATINGIAPIEGDIWIQVLSASAYEFNAIKKNEINVYPVRALQYISGQWVSKEAEIYQNGEWNVLATFVYKSGNQYEELTGGWSFSNEIGGDGFSWTGFTLYTAADGGTYGDLIAVSKGKIRVMSNLTPIDLTPYRTLKTRILAVESIGSMQFQLWASTGKNIYETYVARKTETIETGVETVVSLDVSGVSSQCYLLHAHTSSVTAVHVLESWLEV